MKIKAAIFDMDGTLINSLIYWDLFWAHIGEKFLGDKTFKPSDEDDKAIRTLTMKMAMQLIHDNYNIASTQELVDEANKMIIDFYSNTVELKAGVKEFLEHCKAQGVKMCIASATEPQFIKLALDHCGISEYFLKVFSCSDIGKGKDEPDIFIEAMEFLGEDIKDTYMFEDSIVAIETATKLGLPTVAVYDSHCYSQDRMKEIATEYIAEGETFLKLI